MIYRIMYRMIQHCYNPKANELPTTHYVIFIASDALLIPPLGKT